LDDNRLVDGATGERTIFKQRGEPNKLGGGHQRHPKRLLFVMDVSKSMGRGSDRRLDRMAGTTLMLMEALHAFVPHKFDYAITGHDGDSPIIPFVDFGRPPQSAEDRLAVLEMMYYNVGTCGTGDHTEAAARHAIQVIIIPHPSFLIIILFVIV
jgi:hypothetical protein